MIYIPNYLILWQKTNKLFVLYSLLGCYVAYSLQVFLLDGTFFLRIVKTANLFLSHKQIFYDHIYGQHL